MTPEQLIRRDTAKHFKNVHKALLIHTYEQEDKEAEKSEKLYKQAKTSLVVAIIVGCLFIMRGCDSPAMASTMIVHGYSNAQICEAIRKTENSKTHPYGIMTTYKHTTPRQACLNSIKSARKRWNGEGDFIEFLGKSYSPPDINPNWFRLVHYFLNKSARESKKALT